MAKENVAGIELDDRIVPVKPAIDSYRVPFITDPTSFMMYGENALQAFNEEVKRVEAEIRKEVYGNVEEKAVVVKKKSVNACSVIAVIFGLLVLAELVVGKFFTISSLPTIFVVAGGVDGLTYILNIINGFTSGSALTAIPPVLAIGIALVAIFSIITLLTGLFTIKKQGTSAFMKVCLFISFVGAVVIAVTLLIDGKELAIGLYILMGLTFISTLIGFCSKSQKKKNKAE